VAPTLIQEGGPRARPIEAKRAELAGVPAQVALDDDEVAAIRRIGDNAGCMALKGAAPGYDGPAAADRWPLAVQLEDLGRRWGIEPARDLVASGDAGGPCPHADIDGTAARVGGRPAFGASMEPRPPPGDKHLQLRLPSRPDSIGIVRACVRRLRPRPRAVGRRRHRRRGLPHVGQRGAARLPQPGRPARVRGPGRVRRRLRQLEITEHLADGVPSLGVDLALVERMADDVRVTTPSHGERVVHASFARSRRMAV
jgi:hypothetical protein